MRPDDIDWGVLRGSLVLLAVAVVIGVGLMVATHQFWAGQDREYRRDQRVFTSARGRYQTVDEEERTMATYLPHYRDLEAVGVIGRERRLDWIEALREVARELKLPSVRYDLGSQDRYTPAFKVDSGAYEVYASRMTLNLGLLHEEDLPRLLEVLRERAVGLFTVSSCAIERVAPEFGRSPTEANLNARCTLEWLTIRQPETGGGTS
ncbi:MAG: hypothetical protein H6983_21630 [Ectothiorhodospiraceae bacterium]|nr:hypothetical protein [Chromatiales bacterium]MCP5156791.1 hypothetical protein [Ectothiorhodospiraceae bacterium]